MRKLELCTPVFPRKAGRVCASRPSRPTMLIPNRYFFVHRRVRLDFLALTLRWLFLLKTEASNLCRKKTRRTNKSKDSTIHMAVGQKSYWLKDVKGKIDQNLWFWRFSFWPHHDHKQKTVVPLEDFIHNFADGLFLGFAFYACSATFAWSMAPGPWTSPKRKKKRKTDLLLKIIVSELFIAF